MTRVNFLSHTVGLAESVAALEEDALRKLELILEAVGASTIAYLRSLTSEMRPPARGKDEYRRAHPGHWADVTGQLANSYSYEVERRGDDEVVLILRNDAEHAIYLEAREGFFVLSGVADPGGPVEQAIRRVVPIVAPGWEVR
jgi:hypothetical protein